MIWLERRGKNPARVLAVDILDLAHSYRCSSRVYLQSCIVLLLSISQFLCAIWRNNKVLRWCCSFCLPSFQVELPWVCINSEFKVKRYCVPALNTILPNLIVCKPKYFFDYFSFTVSLEVRYCQVLQSYSSFSKFFWII